MRQVGIFVKPPKPLPGAALTRFALNLPAWGQLQGLAANSASGRFYYSTATDVFRSIPVYEATKLFASSGKVQQPATPSRPILSSKAQKLQHLNNSLAAPPVSPSYESNDDLFSRIDGLWQSDDPNHKTDVIDRAISYLKQSGKSKQLCLADLLEAIKRKALGAAEKGEAMQISIREVTGLHWARKWGEEQQLLKSRKVEEILPWVRLVVQLGFLSPVSNDDFFIHLS